MKLKLKYHQLNLTERKLIQRHYELARPCVEIGEMLGRHRRTIEREIKRYTVHGRYDAIIAHDMYLVTRSRASSVAWKFQTRMLGVIRVLMRVDRLTPEQICQWCYERGLAMVGKTWIYRLIRRDRDQGGKLYKLLARMGRKRKWRGAKKEAGRGHLKNTRNISERPAIVAEKVRLGDGEVDTIEGKGKKSCLVTYVDRVTKYLKIGRAEGLSSDLVTTALIKAVEPIAPYVKTITSDNGKEFARHEEIAARLDCDFFFCDPNCAWQRGLNENTNELVRRFFPKGTDFLKVSDEDVQFVENMLNGRLRKTLNWSTPDKEFAAACTKLAI